MYNVRVQRSRRAEHTSSLEQRAVEFLAFDQTLQDLDGIARSLTKTGTRVAPETIVGEKNRRRLERLKQQQQAEESLDTLTYTQQLEAAAEGLVSADGAACCCTCRRVVDRQTEGWVALMACASRATMLGPVGGGPVEWSDDGEAMLHRECYDSVLQNVSGTALASRTKFNSAVPRAEFHSSLDDAKGAATRVAAAIRQAKHCVILSGAGISTVCGVPDYNGRSGIKTRERLQRPAPNRVCYEQLRPSLAHEVVAELVRVQLVAEVISSNTDGLHLLSGVPSGKLHEISGNCMVERCRGCGKNIHRQYVVIRSSKGSEVCECCSCDHTTGRNCSCGGTLEDTMINQGDPPDAWVMNQAQLAAEKADLIIVLGSSLSYTPVVSLVEACQGRTVLVGTQITPLDKRMGDRVFAQTDEFMRLVISAMLGLQRMQAWQDSLQAKQAWYDSRRRAYGDMRQDVRKETPARIAAPGDPHTRSQVAGAELGRNEARLSKVVLMLSDLEAEVSTLKAQLPLMGLHSEKWKRERERVEQRLEACDLETRQLTHEKSRLEQFIREDKSLLLSTLLSP